MGIVKHTSCVFLLGFALVSTAQGETATRRDRIKRDVRRTGRESTGKTTSRSKKGKGSKGSFGGESKCECQGIVEYKFFESEMLFQLALARTAGTDFGTVDLSTADFTYTQAIALAPPNCHIASAASDFEQLRLQSLGGGIGFVGAYKDIEEAFEDMGSSYMEARRSGWTFLDGADVQDDFWNAGQPPRVFSTSVTDIPSVAVYDGSNGLNAVSLESTAAGAYYRCCYSVLPDCFNQDPTNLQNVLIPVVEAAMIP